MYVGQYNVDYLYPLKTPLPMSCSCNHKTRNWYTYNSYIAVASLLPNILTANMKIIRSMPNGRWFLCLLGLECLILVVASVPKEKGKDYCGRTHCNKGQPLNLWGGG